MIKKNVSGVDNFLDDVEFMTNKRPFVFWRICWVFLTPILLCTIFIYFMISLDPLSYNNEYYPTSAYGIVKFLNNFKSAIINLIL